MYKNVIEIDLKSTNPKLPITAIYICHTLVTNTKKTIQIKGKDEKTRILFYPINAF